MKDSHGRHIDYMRISITDRCNLRCGYCAPNEFAFLPHDDILRYEELLKVCAAAVNVGISNFKITGGEPLARKGCIDFIGNLKKLSGVEHVTMTTNGILLKHYINELREVDLDGINISLDSLNEDTYQKITGSNMLPAVLESLNDTIEAGIRVKVNCVIIKDLNENEIIPLARLTETKPLDVRFIELMPTDGNSRLTGIVGAEVLAVLKSVYPDLTEDTTKHGFGPARYYKSAKLKGGIGLISAFGDHFCHTCNRVRLTSEGFLKLCLYHGKGVDIRAVLRGGATQQQLESALETAIYTKPKGHFGSSQKPLMSKIGG